MLEQMVGGLKGSNDVEARLYNNCQPQPVTTTTCNIRYIVAASNLTGISRPASSTNAH